MTEQNNEYNYGATERRIVEDVHEVQQHADEYGEEVTIVGRRSVFADSNGRGDGSVYEYKLSDGRIVSNEECWELANAKKIKGVIGSHNHGRKHIKTIGDGDPNNNLGSLPTF